MSDENTTNSNTPDIAMLDAQQSAKDLLADYEQQLAALPADATDKKAILLLDMAEAFLALERNADAWREAREAFELFLQLNDWQGAVESCNVLFQTEQDESIAALGMGIWLGVTFPVQASTTIAALQNLIEETPANADGAAVAAAAAHYVADLRSEDDAQRESLTFLTGHILGQVAERHSQISSQDEFDIWFKRLELDNPQVFLPRLATVIDVIVDKNWWFDRDELRRLLPDN